jgi:hypothetical protein
VLEENDSVFVAWLEDLRFHLKGSFSFPIGETSKSSNFRPVEELSEPLADVAGGQVNSTIRVQLRSTVIRHSSCTAVRTCTPLTWRREN